MISSEYVFKLVALKNMMFSDNHGFAFGIKKSSLKDFSFIEYYNDLIFANHIEFYKSLNQLWLNIFCFLRIICNSSFSQARRKVEDLYFGLNNGAGYRLNGNLAPYFHQKHRKHSSNFIENFTAF